MSTYIIGDVQGCFAELQELLKLIKFNPEQDRLGFVGDIVNRGPDSLRVLRFIKNLRDPLVVLGNHDLFLLIIGYGLIPEDEYPHTLQDILKAPDKNELLEWLRRQALIFLFEKSAVLVHAGIPPQWSIANALHHANEVENVLRGQQFKDFLKGIFGNHPDTWSSHLQGLPRLRYITNALVRMRFCDDKGMLDLESTGTSSVRGNSFKPWFQWRKKLNETEDILFGHWASLNGQCDVPQCYALDTGCAWGNTLTCIRLGDKRRFSVAARS